MTTSVRLLRPLDSKRERTLFRLATLAEQRGIPMLLCGAFARDVLFDYMHGMASYRRTTDLDLSVQMPDWESFKSFSQLLRENGFRNKFPDRHAEKFVYEENGQELDLMPFGALSEVG